MPAYYHCIRLYNKAEIVRLLRKAGLRQIRVFSDIDGSPYHPKRAQHPYYVGIKK